MRDTGGARPPPPSPILRFHHLHGTSISLSPDRRVATRDQGFGNGIVFSSSPIKIDEKVCVELTQTEEWSGAVRLGVTSQDPDRLTQLDLPRYVCPDLTNKEGHWARALSERYAYSGSRVTFYINQLGQMHYFVNNEHKGILLNHLPTNLPLWTLLDVYGNTRAAKFTAPDEAPVEILARGPDAMLAYHAACEQGTQAVFRTRLMLVGQDRVGKTSLKRALTGQGYNRSEASTDGIDLSASCSFNLRERKSWRLAMNGEGGGRGATGQHLPGSLSSLEEEYNQAIASNIVHELLYRQRERHLQDQTDTDKHGTDKEGTDKHGTDKPSTDSTDKPPTDTTATPRQNIAKDKTSLLDDLGSYKPLAEMPERVVELVEEMIRERETRGNTASATSRDARTGSNIVLNIWDFAGQAVYYTTHQVFLSSRAVYIIVFNLCHDLDHLILPRTHKSVNEAESERSELSSFDYMNFWMNSIHVHTAENTRNSVDNTALSPPIFIVGTHRNAVHDDPDTRQLMVEEKLEAVRRALQGRPYHRHIIPDFYAVENSLEDGEDKEICRLRQHIEEVASKESYMGEQMPIKWLKFEQSLTKLVDNGTYFASLDQIRAVAGEVGMVTDHELSTLLAFYHDLGLIVYYGHGGGTLDNTLRNTVILKPQWLIDMFKRIITVSHDQMDTHSELWSRLDSSGLLDERLVDAVWRDVSHMKPVLLGLMDKFDLICEQLSTNTTVRQAVDQGRTYYVPSRLSKCPDSQTLYTPSDSDVIFYLDFHGFLPDGLFHRVLTRSIRWTEESGGHEPQLFYRKAKFFLDSEHDFVLEMAPPSLARIKVSVLRMVDLDESDESSSDENEDKPMPPPKPAACAKVRNFLEASLCELRELWMKRVSYRAVVTCYCDRPCVPHNAVRCTHDACLHFLNLDQCLSNKIVCCEHRRIKTTTYRRWFPVPAPLSRRGPVLPESLVKDMGDHMFGNIEATKGHQLPAWVKSAAKLLNGGSEGQDWTALANKLGYSKTVDKFTDDLNPGLALLTDWIVNSGNTSLSVDMIIACLEQMMRDDIIDIVQKGRESEVAPPQVFISYQWDSQDEVNAMRNRLETHGYTCWMDIGQMGGGDQLYARVDEGIRNAKVVISCITPKYVTSHYCNRELGLADLLRKPILPVMYEKVPWPPPGGMSLIFSQLVYINMKGIGGHGGSGVHADLESRYQEIITRAACYAIPDSRSHDTSPDLSKQHPALSPDSVLSHHDDPLIITDYSHTLTHSGRRRLQQQQQQQPIIPLQQQIQPQPPVEGSLGTLSLDPPPRLVEEVSVTKCAVCTLL